MAGQQPPPQIAGAIDLAALRDQKAEADRMLQQFADLAMTRGEHFYRNVRDTEDIEESFGLGYTVALQNFIDLTTGGGIDVDPRGFAVLATLAWAEIRGMLWASAVAYENAGEVNDDLAAAFVVASNAGHHHHSRLVRLRDNIGQALRRAGMRVADAMPPTPPWAGRN